MLIRYYDHAFFTLETAKGTVVAFDPYSEKVGYPLPQVMPHVLLMSHPHHDHANRAYGAGARLVLDTPCKNTRCADVQVRGIAAFHDNEQGQKRGENTLFRVEADGLSVLHLGDLGHALSDEQLKQIGRIDILFLPMGGHYTIDAVDAKGVMEQIRPKVTIPMHYKTDVNADWPISRLSDFTRFFTHIPLPMPLIRVTEQDVDCLPSVVVMERMS